MFTKYYIRLQSPNEYTMSCLCTLPNISCNAGVIVITVDRSGNPQYVIEDKKDTNARWCKGHVHGVVWVLF